MYFFAHNFLLLSLAVSVAMAFYGIFLLWKGNTAQFKAVELAQVFNSVCLVTVSGILLYALVACDFSVEYVASYTERALPLFYRVTAFWAGQAGSLLFWALMVSLCGTAFLFTPTYRNLSNETRLWFIVLFLSVMAFFTLLVSTWNDPFVVQISMAPDGNGLNPLLQNPGMIFHPPLLFLGYGGFVIPGCLALAQALSSQKDAMHWIDAARPFTLTGWLFLSAGIVLGAWWAYMELGWGGYWAWDPVENASLLPWLIATAALHTCIVEQRRNKLRRTNIFLMSLTTVSAFFATYLVRGNVVNSVHGYGEGNVGPMLLVFVLVFLATIIYVSFNAKESTQKGLDGLETREGFVVMTVWLLIALCTVILIATLWPVISKIWTERPVGLDANFYNHVCLPLFAVLLALLAICPWLKWQGGINNWKLFGIVLASFIGSLVVMWQFGNTKALPLMSSSLCVAVLCGMAFQLAQKNVRAWMPSVMACLVHISVALVALGISFSGPYKQEVETVLGMNETVKVGSYTAKLSGMFEGEGANYDFIEAEIQIYKGDTLVSKLNPQRRLYHKFQRSAFSEATTYPSLGSEFYATLLGLDGEKAVLRMSSNPLVNWLWIGGALMSLAPFLGLRRRKTAVMES